MSYAIADKAKMESAATVLHGLIAKELEKGKNAKFPRAKVLQMLSQAMYSRTHEELLATVYTPAQPISNPRGKGAIVITHYQDWITLYINGEFADHAHKSMSDFENAHKRLMQKANSYAKELETDVVEAHLPEIFTEEELQSNPVKDLAISMGYFCPEGSIFTQLEKAHLIVVNDMICSTRLHANWHEAVADEFLNDDMYDIDGDAIVWTIECTSFSSFGQFSCDVYFHELRNAKCINPQRNLWTIPRGAKGDLTVSFARCHGFGITLDL